MVWIHWPEMNETTQLHLEHLIHIDERAILDLELIGVGVDVHLREVGDLDPIEARCCHFLDVLEREGCETPSRRLNANLTW